MRTALFLYVEKHLNSRAGFIACRDTLTIFNQNELNSLQHYQHIRTIIGCIC